MGQVYESHAGECAVPRRGARRSSATFGIVLVVLGVAMLWAQFTPSVDWWAMWPLALIVLGAVQAFTPDYLGQWGLDRLAEGFGTVVLGAVLLGNTTGYLPWEMWLTFFSLWPVLLVSAGIALIGRAANQSWIRFLAPALIWATLAYSAAAALGFAPIVVPELMLVVR